MLKKIGLSLVIVLGLFLTYVSTRKSEFYYERNGLIAATPEKIFPYLSNFRLGGEWSPYEKDAPSMKKVFNGSDATVGSSMEFDSKESGSGKLEIIKIVTNESVDIKLTMTKPFTAENIIHYRLTPEGAGTRFSWAMDGDGGFMGKLMSVLIDCEKMMGDKFESGIKNLKQVVESSGQ